MASSARSRTAELFAERWTPIVVRNLLNGCSTFTAIRQGAPGTQGACWRIGWTRLSGRGSSSD